MIRVKFVCIGILLGLAIVCEAQAAIVVFTNRVDFNLAIDSDPSLTKFFEGWDSFSPGDTPYSNPNFVVTDQFRSLSPPNTLARGINLGFGRAFFNIIFTNSVDMYAFGVSFNTLSTATGDYVLEITNPVMPDVIPSFYDPFPGFDTGQFAGFISDTPFRQIRIRAITFNQYSLDDLTVAEARVRVVPEPASLWLLVAGLVGAAGMLRKRSKQNLPVNSLTN